MIYRDRAAAGKFLANKLWQYAYRDDVLVLALPRGGVPVAYEVAKALDLSLDLFMVRKLGVPGQEELAMGAIATGGVRVLNQEVVEYLNIPQRVIELITEKELKELRRRERAYRGDLPEPEVKGRVVILVDDGLATGSTMRAAVQALRLESPAKIVVVVPVSAAQVCDRDQIGADEIVCGATPEPFYGVGRWYDDFSQTSDEEVRELLKDAHTFRSHEFATT